MSVNKKHLLKIKQHILDEPLRLNMSHWLDRNLPSDYTCVDEFVDLEHRFGQQAPRCKTVGCIAGWSAGLRGLERIEPSDEKIFLGLKSGSLFFPNQWPLDLYNAYKVCTTPLEKAQVVGRAIDRIIEGDGEF